MTLEKFLRALDDCDCFTIGAEDGNGWIYYHNGEGEMKEIPDWLLDREVISIYDREERVIYDDDEMEYCVPLKAGLGIIVSGDECGDI